MINVPLVMLFLASANRRLHWDLKKLKRFQEKRLRHVIRYAYNFVPFYHTIREQIVPYLYTN